MDPAKCLEILGCRGTCGRLQGGHHHRPDAECANENIAMEVQPSQATADTAVVATMAASRVRSGQVINLATGTNETQAAREAVQAISSSVLSSSSLEDKTSKVLSPSGNMSNTVIAGQAMGSELGEKEDGQKATSGTDNGVLKELEGVPAEKLLEAFRRAQQERVSLYKKFNGGLKMAFRDADYSGYPALCCEVTASFSVLSKAVNAIETILNSRPETKTLGSIIRKIQGHEKQLLTLTAAHHLESMREARVLGMGPGMGAYAGQGSGKEQWDATSTSPGYDRLLREEIEHLARRAEAETRAVSELLDDLRYEAEELE